MLATRPGARIYFGFKDGVTEEVFKKAECKEIAAFIDSKMSALGFTRIMLTPIPNMDDATIYRMTGRYKALISKNNEIFRR